MQSPRRQLVEILGVAGAGKSSLSRNLCQPEVGWYPASFLDVRRTAHLRYVLHSLPAVLPLFIRGIAPRPRISWREFKLLIYVTEWQRYLDRNWQPDQRMYLLDQGPIYALGRLEALASAFTGSPAYRRWQSRMTQKWGATLTHIIFLDAPDPVLMERIQRRSQHHETKGQSLAASLEFLGRHRKAFDRIVGEVEKVGSADVIHLDTGATSLDELVTLIATRLGN